MVDVRRMMKSLALCCFLALATPACHTYTPLTSVQLTELGTHRYSNVTREKAVESCGTALTTLGYKVTVLEPASGMVKTAPHTIMVSASGNQNTASATEDGVAWSIVVEASGADVVFHATPRAFRNGSELHEDGMWVEEIMNSKFQDLWHELDSMLGAQPAAK